jgi:hypothetical protein
MHVQKFWTDVFACMVLDLVVERLPDWHGETGVTGGENNGEGTLRGGRTLQQFETPDDSGRQSWYMMQIEEG